MVRSGVTTALARDLTGSMYNPLRPVLTLSGKSRGGM